MNSKSKVCRPGAVSHEHGGVLSDLACFVRWAEYQSGPSAKQKSQTMKTQVACRDCGTVFVKYAYEGLVRCETCREARRKALQDVRK